eukprot:scaffold39294_cov34-Tisochrysis_lutea.AAC.3
MYARIAILADEQEVGEVSIRLVGNRAISYAELSCGSLSRKGRLRPHKGPEPLELGDCCHDSRVPIIQARLLEPSHLVRLRLYSELCLRCRTSIVEAREALRLFSHVRVGHPCPLLSLLYFDHASLSLSPPSFSRSLPLFPARSCHIPPPRPLPPPSGIMHMG